MIHPANVRLDRSDGRTVALLSGEIDLSNAAVVRGAITESISNQVVELVVDLSDVHYLDSAGIAMLFDLSRRLAEHEQRLIVVALSESLVRRSLEVSGWPSDVPILESFDEAVE